MTSLCSLLVPSSPPEPPEGEPRSKAFGAKLRGIRAPAREGKANHERDTSLVPTKIQSRGRRTWAKPQQNFPCVHPIYLSISLSLALSLPPMSNLPMSNLQSRVKSCKVRGQCPHKGGIGRGQGRRGKLIQNTTHLSGGLGQAATSLSRGGHGKEFVGVPPRTRIGARLVFCFFCFFLRRGC